jgi:hypothetical protein
LTNKYAKKLGLSDEKGDEENYDQAPPTFQNRRIEPEDVNYAAAQTNAGTSGHYLRYVQRMHGIEKA